MTYDDVLIAQREARETIAKADHVVRSGTRLSMGRLRVAQVDDDVLRALKLELRGFNAKTGKWVDLT